MITIHRVNGCLYDLIRDEKLLFSCASEENAQLAKAEIERLEAEMDYLRELADRLSRMIPMEQLSEANDE